MRLIGRDKLKRAEGEMARWMRSWCAEVAHAHWHRPEDIIEQFPNARARSESDFVFPIGSTGYWVRLQVAFAQGVALVLEMNKNNAPYGT